MHRILGLAFVLSVMTLAPASAAPTMKPGLWNVTSKIDMGAATPKLSPKQLEMMRRMNVKLPGMDGSAVTTQMCVSTKEKVDAMAYANKARKSLGCEPRNVRTMGSTTSADIVCNGRMKGQGHTTMTYYGNTKYASDYAFKGSSSGRPIDMKTHSSGQFVSSDCGAVQSYGAQ